MNPSGLCLCGCGLPTSIARNNDARRGWVKGQPKDYLHGHAIRLERYRFLANVGARDRRQRLLKRRQRTQKQGPYKAGATLKAKAAVGKIEAALRRRG